MDLIKISSRDLVSLHVNVSSTLRPDASRANTTSESVTDALPVRASRNRDNLGLPHRSTSSRALLHTASFMQERIDLRQRIELASPAAMVLCVRSPETARARAQTEIELLGPKRLRELDRRFGKAEWPPIKADGRSSIKPCERHRGDPFVLRGRIFISTMKLDPPPQVSATEDQPMVAPAIRPPSIDVTQALNLAKAKTGEINYMYAVTLVGTLVIGEEVPVANAFRKGNRPEHLGHSTLTGGGPARICGELRYDVNASSFYVNNNSGRYNQHYPDRGPEQLENVAQCFRDAGLSVLVHYRHYETQPLPVVSSHVQKELKHGMQTGPHELMRFGSLHL